MLNEERRRFLIESGKGVEYVLSDVIVNKVAIIEKRIKRTDEEYRGNQENLKNYTKQDSLF